MRQVNSKMSHIMRAPARPNRKCNHQQLEWHTRIAHVVCHWVVKQRVMQHSLLPIWWSACTYACIFACVYIVCCCCWWCNDNLGDCIAKRLAAQLTRYAHCFNECWMLMTNNSRARMCSHLKFPLTFSGAAPQNAKHPASVQKCTVIAHRTRFAPCFPQTCVYIVEPNIFRAPR